MAEVLGRRTLFREVNSKIREINTQFGGRPGGHVVLCECGSVDCYERFEVPDAVYGPRRSDEFIVLPGHQDARDHVVDETSRFVIVRSTPCSPGALVLGVAATPLARG